MPRAVDEPVDYKPPADPLVHPELAMPQRTGDIDLETTKLLRSLHTSARWIVGLLIVVVLILAFRGN